ncbi:Alpha-L-rhamnosidase N-terminal domain-containing protein [Filimonas lacunae]|uniref:alpha-L-rhamnosidase n=1 Tax=Filimonas lacunae TaxID=477680 RepID=A0A173MC55_9BACT|nr:family 78 glycoside hydrolase catalytic domain [Filimonas lacunae]BAV05163.1 secreted protein [Filimonas lacunae]SIT22844.1 Alpha-L-rhamnosidase N-terminal domain-containing protein [Filimonas lacunae]
MKYRIVSAIVNVFFVSVLSAQPVQVQQLTCEYFTNPVGIGAESPVFGWQLLSQRSNIVQQACQVLVAENPGLLSEGKADVWNSGKVATRASVNFIYKGKKLLPGHTYYWQVRVWDKNGGVSAWSQVAKFTTALFDMQDWSNARWIGFEDLEDSMRVVPGVHSPDKKKIPAGRVVKRATIPLFRKEFAATKRVAQALAFVSGLGQYEMNVNGAKVGTGFLTPGWTFYDKRCLYNTYDITNRITQGKNAVGVIVGTGFYYINREKYFKLLTAYGMPKLLCKIQITYTDGTQDVIVSGPDWKTAPSAITYSSMYSGEEYDARLEQQGWDKPGFTEAKWKPALQVTAPRGILQAENDYPVTVKQELAVRTIQQPAPGIAVYDFGQNASGIVELKVKGKKGQAVKLTPAELLLEDGLANQKATGKPYYFLYTLKGDGEETWRPRFSYYGFRYVQVEVLPDSATSVTELPTVTGLTMLHTSNGAPASGSFSCSNPLFNRIDTLIQWAIKSNVQSVATDCPHREKLSWLEQDYLMGGSIQHNINVYHLYKKLVWDMMDAQTPEGIVPDITPEYVFFDDHGFGFRDSPEWGSASVIVPWLVYKWYGDTALLRQAYPMMKKYVAYLQSRADKQILDYGLGDWYDLGPQRPGVAQLTPKALTATAIYYYDVALLSKVAALLKNTGEATGYVQQAAAIKTAFNTRFYNAATHVYSTGSQTAMAMPLCVGLVDEAHKTFVFNNLVDSIQAGGGKLTAGDIGFHFLVQALQEGGASQLLYEMNNRDDVPGYGYQLKKGATALTESWQALKEVSNNHLMLGHIMEWFYAGLAGINQEESATGYQQLVIRPQLVNGIDHAKATYQSVYGPVTSGWQQNSAGVVFDFDIPGNASATVYVPVPAGGKILQNGKALQQVVRSGKGVVKIALGSGLHKLEISKL